MWIQVRTIDCKKTVRLDHLSKLTKIEELRERLVEHFDAEPKSQRLFFRGKQLEDGHTLFDYDVGLNDLIQLMVRSRPAPLADSTASTSTEAKPDTDTPDSHKAKDAEENVSDKENKEPDSDTEIGQQSSSVVCLDQDDGNIYKVGDVIDARDPTMGAWFEAKILEVYRDRSGIQQPTSRPATQPGPSAMETDSAADGDSSAQADSANSQATASKSSDDAAGDGDGATNKKEDCDEKPESSSDPEGEKVKTASSRGGATPKKTDGTPKKADNDTPKKTDASECMEVEDNKDVSQKTDEVDGNTNKAEASTVLTPKKISTSKENTAGGASKATSRLLFVKEVSDDLKKKGILCETTVTDGFIYKVLFDGYEDDETVELTSKSIRPRARHTLRFEDIKVGQTIMANYNYEEPESRGFWYDCLVTHKKEASGRGKKPELLATVYLGVDLMPLEKCRLMFLTELFDIEAPGTQLSESDVQMDPSASPAKRQNKPNCDVCKDNIRRKCRECACRVCGGKHDPQLQLMCDECDKAYHLQCLNPPLLSVPDDDDWYCPDCKRDENEVVKAGEKLKESKKKSKMASASSSSTSRDWGRGMACVGRTKQCTIVPSNHYGPIPGVEVGTMWKFRVQVSEAGVHRPHVAGIHGREEDGAFSIVLSGGYEDDADNGDEFYYTGSGGRDLSGNKRTAEQSCDQKLSRMNKALAKNCNVAIDSRKGAEAKDWQGGKPVRVVRNCKGRKHSKYAPEEGNRYDGIYKVVKYWSEKGKSGFLVWRYLLRRDDPAPGPWTKAGKKRSKELDLTMQYPEGYVSNTSDSKDAKDDSDEEKPKKKRGRKRKAEESPSASPKDKRDVSEVKKAKLTGYTVDPEVLKLIKEDSVNQKLWDDALEYTAQGKQKFLQYVSEEFMCICCQEILYKPVGLQCSHNFCKPCISRSFKAEVYSCPTCRKELPKEHSMAVNTTLKKILNHLFPGYEAGRE